MSASCKIPLGPEPTLISRKEVDALYETLAAVVDALQELGIDYVVTGGSLLGAVRQHSILFCDDDIDIAVIDPSEDGSVYQRVQTELPRLLPNRLRYQVRPWEGGDRIRPQSQSNVFVDLFVLRRYRCWDELREVIGVKKNRQSQPDSYVNGIMETIESSASRQNETQPIFPFWHFTTRKAIEMWSKEVYRESELFPLSNDYRFGPLTGIKGPRCPVTLLRRAFGDDCFDVYYQSGSHTGNKDDGKHHDANGGQLPPRVAAGGVWEGGQKMLLRDEHYQPMQPVARAQRRYTGHGRESLMDYLKEQTRRETLWMAAATSPSDEQKQSRRPRTVYMDGVFDLFHVGHLEAIEQCARLGSRVIIGVTGDADATDYKRPPIIKESDRVAVVAAVRAVDEVICPCPLVVPDAFVEELGIDLVVHGFADDADAKRQESFFAAPIARGKFVRITYYDGLSTSGIIEKIKSMPELDGPVGEKSQKLQKWFGAALAKATLYSVTIPTDPFPLHLRQVVEPHIEKARRRRKDSLAAIRHMTGESEYDDALRSFRNCRLSQEGDFHFDPADFPIREAFLHSTGLSSGAHLSRLHDHSGAKEAMLLRLTENFLSFQQAYDRFVRHVCLPYFDRLVGCAVVYYQAFPCVRVVQPTDFSIGPHADVAYGHHPCSVNFYLPLTVIGGASSLFLESRSGSEDWHPIVGDYGLVKHFPGSICVHWTTENTTADTRVSLDFRLISGNHFETMKCGGSLSGGTIDVYRREAGYYSCARKQHHADGQCSWESSGPMPQPDARCGFPWTEKSWSKIHAEPLDG